MLLDDRHAHLPAVDSYLIITNTDIDFGIRHAARPGCDQGINQVYLLESQAFFEVRPVCSELRLKIVFHLKIRVM